MGLLTRVGLLAVCVGGCTFAPSTFDPGRGDDAAPGNSGDSGTPIVDGAPGDVVDGTPGLVDATPGTPDAMADATPGPEPIVIRINLNGPAHTGVDFPGQWAADENNACDGSASYQAGDIQGTVDDPLFNYNYYGVFTCAIGAGLPSGNYTVSLLFGENHRGAGCPNPDAGRVFDALVEGVLVLDDYDLLEEGGGCLLSSTTVGGAPVKETFTANVTDGVVNVQITSNDNGTLHAVEVIQQL